jgi:outer membrane protein assembly factor BamB
MQSLKSPLGRLLTALSVAVVLSSNSVAQQTDSGCDYSAAAENFGWGWDPITGISCPPADADQIIDLYLPSPGADEPSRETLIDELRTDYCDYTDAALHSGWGWNNVLLESCPPLLPNTAPVVINEIALPFLDYPLHLQVSSDSILYLFHPAKNTLAARQTDGTLLWEEPLENSTFLTDIQLSPNQDLLLGSSLGGRLVVFRTDGSVAWQVDQPGVSNSGPDIQVGDKAIIAYYVPEERFDMDPFIVSYDFDGTVRWRYEGPAHQAKQIEEFTLGADGLVYIRVSEPELDGKRYVIVEQ